MTTSGPICPHHKKRVASIDGVRIDGGKIVLISVVSSNSMTYEIMVSVPAENTYIYNIRHHLSPK
jgi:hypothetical protein